MSRLTKVSIDSVLYDIGSKGINSYATLSEMVNEKVSELYDGCIAWCNEDKKYYQWLSENEIISQFGRWRELEFGSEFQVSDPTVDASTEKYKGKIIQYVGVDDVTSGFKRGCFYESRLSNVINYVVATVDASTVGTYYTLDDEGSYNPITLIGDGTGYDASTVYYKKQDVEVYSWAYINSLKVETEFDETSENAIANGIITKKFDEVIQDYTDKNDALKEYVDTDVVDALKQYADDLIADVEEVTEDKVWSNSKTKDYVDTTLEDYTKSATEILQADYDALTDEEKLANNYHCTDSGRLYYKGILYGDKKPIELTYEEYKTLEEAGLVETDVDYIVKSNESGVLLSNVDIEHGTTGTTSYEVIETLKNDVENLIDDSNLTSTTSTLSASKIRSAVTHSFNTQDGKVKYLKLKLDVNPISVVDIYGGKIEILGANNSSANPSYKTVKVVRHSYGDWTSYDATQVPSALSTKIGSLYYYPTDNYYYLQLNNYAHFIVTGALTKPETVTNLPTEISAMTLIPETDWGKIDDTSTNTTSTWSSSKIASEISAKGTKTQYRGSQSIDISTSSQLTFIYSSMYASQAGCYMLLSNYNTTPLLIELGKFPQSSFNVTATNKSFGVDTITVTTASDEYSWYVLQF